MQTRPDPAPARSPAVPSSNDERRGRPTSDDVPDFLRRPAGRDIEGAEEFYLLGPHALRALKRRHGRGPGPLSQEAFSRLVRDELHDAVGAFEVRPRS